VIGKKFLLNFGLVFSLILISLFLHKEAAASQLEVYDAYFHKDYVEYTGTLHLYLRNQSSQEVSVDELLWQGKSVGPLFQGEWLEKKLSSEHLVKEQKNYLKKRNNDILWYRVWPNPIPAKEIAEVLIRLAKKPQNKKGILQVKSSAGSIEVPFSFKKPEVRLDYISFSPDLKEIDLFVSSEGQNPSDIKEVELNGEKTSFQGSPCFFKGKAYLCVKLNTPLQLGSFPVLHIKTEKDKSFTAMVKAMPGEFRIGAITNTKISYIKSGVYHFLDMMYGCGGNAGLKRLDAHIPYNMQSTTSSNFTVYDYDKETSEQVFYCHPKHILSMANHPMLWGHFFRDEPDGTHPWQISARTMAWCEEVARRLTPDKHTRFTIDHSGWPSDCYAFAEIPEYICVHTFSTPGPNIRSSVMSHCLHAAESSYPQPWWYTAGTYRYGRPNDARENRMELYYALLKGVKGWMYYPLCEAFRKDLKIKRSVVVLEKDVRKYWAGLGRLNAEARLVGDLFFRGWPLAKTDIDTVDVASIVSGKRAIVVPVVNNDFDSDRKKPFTYVPAGKVLVEVSLPDWFRAEDVFSVRYNGLEKLKYESQKDSLNFTVPDLQLTALIVIAGEKGLYENLQNRYNKEIVPKLKLIAQEEADGVIQDFTQTE
jgi:hypothetical protein